MTECIQTGVGVSENWNCYKRGDECVAGLGQIYVQPKRQEIYRQGTGFCRQTVKLEDNSIYRHAIHTIFQ